MDGGGARESASVEITYCLYYLVPFERESPSKTNKYGCSHLYCRVHMYVLYGYTSVPNYDTVVPWYSCFNLFMAPAAAAKKGIYRQYEEKQASLFCVYSSSRVSA